MNQFSNTEEYVEESEIKEKTGWKSKLEGFLEGKYFVPIILILIAIISFSLGRISGLGERKEPVRVISESAGEVLGVTTSPSDSALASPDKPNPSLMIREGSSAPSEFEQENPGEVKGASTEGTVVASKNGSKYHYPWCAGAKQISEKNLITFESIEKARAAGYTPASNCKGLK